MIKKTNVKRGLEGIYKKMISFGKSQNNIKLEKPKQQPKPILTKPQTTFPTIISFASKRKLLLSNATPETTTKRVKIEVEKDIKPPKPNPTPTAKKLCNYDSISERLTRVIDQWILESNAELIRNFINDIQSPLCDAYTPSLRSDVFCLIGPSGSGKNVVIRHILQQLQCKFIIYDEFAEHGNRNTNDESTKKGRHGTKDFLLPKLMEDAEPFVFVVDGPDGEWHTDFQHQLIKEHAKYQTYKRPHKSIVLLVQSLSTFTLRNWIRSIGAYKYYLRDTIKYKEQEFLRQRIHSQCPLRSLEPLQEFAGDFRRMGIDLIACTQEGSVYHRNTNTIAKTPSIFELTRHLMTWPAEPLHKKFVCSDNVDQLLQMCFHNQVKRTNERGGFDEVVRVAQELSDIQVMVEGGDDVDKSLFITPMASNQVFVDCNRYDLSALVFSLYASNLRLSQQGQLQSGTQIQVEFARSRSFVSGWTSQSELDNVELDRFKCVYS